MSAPLVRLFIESQVPEYIREIDRDYHIEMIAEDTQQIRKYHAAAFRQQSEVALVNLRAMGELAQRQDQTNAHLSGIAQDTYAMVGGINRLNTGMDRLNVGMDRLSVGMERVNVGIDRLNVGMERVNTGIDNLNEGMANLHATAEASLDAIYELSGVLGEGLDHISAQMMQQQQKLKEIDKILRRPYETQALELRKEAGKWLTSGMKNVGRERVEDWKDSMRLLRLTIENPLGMQDYVAWFQMAWLLWKQEDNIAEAEEAFYRAQRLSAPNRDLYHLKSLRHLAYMQHLQKKHEDAYQTIQKALSLSSEHDTMYDAARYAAVLGHEKEDAGLKVEAVKLIDKCIGLQPTTIIVMFSEEDFKPILPGLAVLTSKRLRQARSNAEAKIQQWQEATELTKQLAPVADCDISLPDTLLSGVSLLSSRLPDADYLGALDAGKSAISAREEVLKFIRESLQKEIQQRQQTIDVVKRRLSQAENAHANRCRDFAQAKRTEANRKRAIARQKSERLMQEALMAEFAYFATPKPGVFDALYASTLRERMQKLQRGETPRFMYFSNLEKHDEAKAKYEAADSRYKARCSDIEKSRSQQVAAIDREVEEDIRRESQIAEQELNAIKQTLQVELLFAEAYCEKAKSASRLVEAQNSK